MNEQEAKQNLWKCDCSNDGADTDPDEHESGCNYALWYVLNDEEENDET